VESFKRSFWKVVYKDEDTKGLSAQELRQWLKEKENATNFTDHSSTDDREDDGGDKDGDENEEEDGGGDDNGDDDEDSGRDDDDDDDDNGGGRGEGV